MPKKLGLKDGQRVGFVCLPDSLVSLTKAAGFVSVERTQTWDTLHSWTARSFDFIHAFTKSKDELIAHLPRLQDLIGPDGMAWISWPKKASKVPTDMIEDVIRDEALKLDLVDVKVCAVDEIWSGLKLVIRKERRVYD